MEYCGYHALAQAGANRTQEKYRINQGPLPPRWINARKAPRDPRLLAAWHKHRENSWNTTKRSYAPLVFKGLKPITMEPWAVDAILYECDGDRIGGRDKGKPDVQAHMLDEALGYHAAIRDARLSRQAVQLAEFYCC